MRTQEEIVARINDQASEDFLGTQRSELLSRLDWSHAKEFLKPDLQEEKWGPLPLSREDHEVRRSALEYLEFAWGKANDCRGLSAQRSIDHYRAWFWLLGDEEMMAELGKGHAMYGKPQLVKISEKLGVDWRKFDDGRWHYYEGDDGLTADAALKHLAGLKVEEEREGEIT